MELFVATNIEQNTVTLSPEESHHIAKVLRMKTGEVISVTDGKGTLAEGMITAVNPKSVEVAIISVHHRSAPVPSIHLYVSPTRTTDRTEWLIEKATELGAASISFVLCERTARKNPNLDRYRKIALSALKQSFNCYLPKIEMLPSLQKAVETAPGNRLIAACFGENRKKPPEWPHDSDAYSLFIGPEGDFTAEEVDYALQSGCTAVELGKLRLRTETAAITGISYLKLRAN